MPGRRHIWMNGGVEMAISDGAALNRWRLVLGRNAEGAMPLTSARLSRMDDALDFLYGVELVEYEYSDMYKFMEE